MHFLFKLFQMEMKRFFSTSIEYSAYFYSCSRALGTFSLHSLSSEVLTVYLSDPVLRTAWC